jgi:hypothetical protein
MRAPVAVHLDIRPRLTLPAEPRARRRRRFRLPPLALPALGYWLAMAALTYGFTRLGPHPLDDAPSVAQADRDNPTRRPGVTEPPQNNSEAVPPSPPEAAPAPTFPAVEPAAPAASTELEARAPAADPAEPVSPRPEAARPRQAPTEREPGQPLHDSTQAELSFPEFTDSSRPPPRQRAADGPRIDSLFERAVEATPTPPPATPPPVERTPDASPVSSSCEAAIARNNEQMTIGAGRGAPDISREAYASILQDGRYLAGCSIPERAVVEICAAVQGGRAVGITVVTSPPSPQLNACVRRAVSRLGFPANPRLDVTHTRFDAVHR